MTPTDRLAIIESGLRDAAYHAVFLDGHDSYVVDLLDGVRKARQARESIERAERFRAGDRLIDELGAAIDKART